MDMKRLLWGCIVIAAMALVGCGSDGTSLKVGGERATQTLIDALQGKYDAEKKRADDAEGARDAANTARDMYKMALSEIGTTLGVEGTQAAITAAIMGLKEDSDDLAAVRTALSAQLTADGVTNPAMATRAQLVAAINSLEMGGAPTEDPNPAGTKAAGTKRTAITAEAAQGPSLTPANPDAGLGGSDNLGDDAQTGTTDDPYSLEIKRDRTKTTVTIADTGLAGDDDPKFMQAMDLGGGTTMHVRTMKADDDGNVESEVVVVTTDIEAPKGRPFAMFQNAAGETPQALNVLKSSGVGATGDETNDSFDPGSVLDSGTEAHVPILANIKSSAFVLGTGETSKTFDYKDTTNDADTGFTTAGTYNGAEGTYACVGSANCSVTTDSDGKLIGFSDGWIFTPAAGATSDQPDYDYLHYGFWLKRTTDSDGVLTYDEVETFAGSSVAASGAVSTVLGTATYNGGATGVYVHSVTKQDGTELSATSGHFTADAELTATFGQVPVSATDSTGTIAPNQLFTLTGTIDNFDLSGHDEGPGWSVTLQGDIGGGNGSDSNVSGTAKGGDGDGSFDATFHGSVAEVNNVVPKPGSVVGEFNAGFSNGSVAGAFGARLAP